MSYFSLKNYAQLNKCTVIKANQLTSPMLYLICLQHQHESTDSKASLRMLMKFTIGFEIFNQLVVMTTKNYINSISFRYHRTVSVDYQIQKSSSVCRSDEVVKVSPFKKSFASIRLTQNIYCAIKQSLVTIKGCIKQVGKAMRCLKNILA